MSIALYIRLSLADEDTGFSKVESDSITNQRMCLHDYLDKQTQLANIERLEFCDDGFTATNGNRPSFTKMLELVQEGKIKTIIVRDFSRFFRDYIEAGNYLECVFPFLGVRFISINDNYDSDDYKGSTGGLEMVMRNIIYASYSKDLSVKTTTAKIHMMKQGKYVGNTPPYGYVMHPTERNKLAVDEIVAPIIKRIFAEAANGNEISDIVRGLNLENVPTPAKRFKENYPKNNKFKKTSTLAMWEYKIIRTILQNLVYTGTLVSHRRKKESISSKKTIMQEPIIVEGTHEAIISKEDFEKAQKAIDKKKTEHIINSYDYPLKSLVKCGNCKRAMTRTRRKNISNVFVCAYHRANDDKSCKSKKIKENELEEIVYNAISLYVENLKGEVKTHKVNPLDKVTKLSDLQMQVDGIKKLKTRQYKQYVEEEISRDMFVKLKADCDSKIAELETQIEVLSKEKIPVVTNNKTATLINLFTSRENFTNEIAKAFIKAIYIYDDENIEIEWNFKDNLTEV